MKNFRLLLTFGFSLSLLCGCSYATIKGKPIYKKSTEINKMVNQSQWDKAFVEVKNIENLFEKNKWKYQLLGDENEYSGLNQEISRLQASIEEHDKREAKTNILMIQDFIESIYFR